MANNHFGTVNTIGASKTEIGGGKVVWAEVRRVIQFGRKIKLASYHAGDVIPAGSMVVWDNESDECTIVKASELAAPDGSGTVEASSINGLTYTDVCIPEGCTDATTAIVISGKIWADATDVPASVEKNLPMIEFIRVRKSK